MCMSDHLQLTRRDGDAGIRCTRHDVRVGSKLPVRGAFGSRPLSGGKPKQILMIADSWAPTSAIGGTFPVVGGEPDSLLLANSGPADFRRDVRASLVVTPARQETGAAPTFPAARIDWPTEAA